MAVCGGLLAEKVNRPLVFLITAQLVWAETFLQSSFLFFCSELLNQRELPKLGILFTN